MNRLGERGSLRRTGGLYHAVTASHKRWFPLVLCIQLSQIALLSSRPSVTSCRTALLEWFHIHRKRRYSMKCPLACRGLSWHTSRISSIRLSVSHFVTNDSSWIGRLLESQHEAGFWPSQSMERARLMWLAQLVHRRCFYRPAEGMGCLILQTSRCFLTVPE